MDVLYPATLALLPVVVFILCALAAKKLLKSAKKRKGLAIAFGALVQLMLPDPQVEKTIEIMVTQKRKAEKKAQESDQE